MGKLRQFFRQLWEGFLRSSLWWVSIGLMLASSGIDGAYMAKLMPTPLLGYVLNTTSDIGSEILMFWFGRLRQSPKNTKRYKMSGILLIAEAILTGFAWLFGWRQLLPIITTLEDAQTARWLAPVLAAFTPVSLVAVGYAQALLAGKIEKMHSDSTTTHTDAQAKQEQKQESQAATHDAKESAGSNGHKKHTCPHCEREFGSKQAVSAHLRFCEVYQATQGQAEENVG